jgi:hypothetical protein
MEDFWKAFDRVVAVAGAIATLLGTWVVLYGVPDWAKGSSTPVRSSATPLWGYWLIIIGLNPRRLSLYRLFMKPRPSRVPTGLMLQFNAASTNPTVINNQNIWNWYVLSTVRRRMDPVTFQQGSREIASVKLFLVFDRPILFKQITLRSNEAPHPGYEVKDRGPATP